jgi:hypothetical protein
LRFNEDGSVGTPGLPVSTEVGVELHHEASFETHGWLMWATWVFGGFIAFASKRYFKQFWFVADIIHIIMGFWIIGATLVTFGQLYSKYG